MLLPSLQQLRHEIGRVCSCLRSPPVEQQVCCTGLHLHDHNTHAGVGWVRALFTWDAAVSNSNRLCIVDGLFAPASTGQDHPDNSNLPADREELLELNQRLWSPPTSPLPRHAATLTASALLTGSSHQTHLPMFAINPYLVNQPSPPPLDKHTHTPPAVALTASALLTGSTLLSSKRYHLLSSGICAYAV